MPKWHFLSPTEETEEQARAHRWYRQFKNTRRFANLTGMTIREAKKYLDKKLAPWLKQNGLEEIKRMPKARDTRQVQRILKPEDDE